MSRPRVSDGDAIASRRGMARGKGRAPAGRSPAGANGSGPIPAMRSAVAPGWEGKGTRTDVAGCEGSERIPDVRAEAVAGIVGRPEAAPDRGCGFGPIPGHCRSRPRRARSVRARRDCRCAGDGPPCSGMNALPLPAAARTSELIGRDPRTGGQGMSARNRPKRHRGFDCGRVADPPTHFRVRAPSSESSAPALSALTSHRLPRTRPSDLSFGSAAGHRRTSLSRRYTFERRPTARRDHPNRPRSLRHRRRFIEGKVLFPVNFRPRKCPEMRNHTKNLVSGDVYAVFAAAMFSAAQAPRTMARSPAFR